MPPCIRCHKDMPEATPFCPFCGARQERTQHGIKVRGNGSGTVYKRGKTWTAKVIIGWKISEGGKRLPVSRTKGGFRTQTDALQYCAKLIAAQNEPKKAPPLQKYWDMYSAGELLDLSKNRQYTYKNAWKRMKALHMKPVDKITVSDLRETVSAATSTYDPAKAMKTLFAHLFELASADGFASKDLPSHIKLPEAHEKEREVFTDAEQKALWKLYESGDLRAGIPLVMIYTGMMTGEMRRLQTGMIDFDSAQIHGVGLKTKVRMDAPVYLPSIILPALESLCAGKSGKLFPGKADKFYDAYYEALAAAGCRRLTPYACRHTTATALAITEGIAPQTIKKVMRWSTTKMLDRYAHPSTEDAFSAINAIKRPL